MSPEQCEASKHIVDAISIVTVLGTLVQILPAIAAAFPIVWTVIRIWETKTAQTFIKRLRG
jgi:hypothetical protein